MSTREQMATLRAQLVGGPTAVLEYAGLRWLTDPALSPPGEYAGLVKTTPRARRVLTTVAAAERLGATQPGSRHGRRPNSRDRTAQP